MADQTEAGFSLNKPKRAENTWLTTLNEFYIFRPFQNDTIEVSKNLKNPEFVHLLRKKMLKNQGFSI